MTETHNTTLGECSYSDHFLERERERPSNTTVDGAALKRRVSGNALSGSSYLCSDGVVVVVVLL